MNIAWNLFTPEAALAAIAGRRLAGRQRLASRCPSSKWGWLLDGFGARAWQVRSTPLPVATGCRSGARCAQTVLFAEGRRVQAARPEA